MTTQKQLRLSYDIADAKEALEKAIPSMASGFIINTAHGDMSLHDDDARAVMALVGEIASRRANLGAGSETVCNLKATAPAHHGDGFGTDEVETRYVINAKGFFFIVKCAIDTDKLQGCQVFDRYDVFQEEVCRTHNLEKDEVEGLELMVTRRYGVPFMICDRGIASEIYGDVERELSHYEL